MKIFLTLLTVCAASALAQIPGIDPPKVAPPLSRFDLTFEGGNAKEFIQAMTKAAGKPVNVIFSEESSRAIIPAFTVHNATVPDIFSAITTITSQPVPEPNSGAYRTAMTEFKPAGNVISDETVWSLLSNVSDSQTITAIEAAAIEESTRELRHFQLRDYLSDKLTVEDITTAILTGWELLGNKNPPQLRYHKQTGILIAAGDRKSLEEIPMVLQQLPRPGSEAAFQVPRDFKPDPSPAAPAPARR